MAHVNSLKRQFRLASHMEKVIDGRAIAERIKVDLKTKIEKL